MPQSKKYDSPAGRQAAYRMRCQRARQNQASAKGLPSLPSLATMPGWPRWNATFRMAHALLDGAVTEMQDYFDDRSDAWQESERGEDHQERTESAEAVRDALDDLIT